MTQRRARLAPWLVVLLTLPALWPLAQSGFFVSDDGLFHVYRTAALADAWRHGVLWPQLFPDFGFGYGQAVLHFYAPLSYVPAALLSLLGLHPAAAVQVTLALSFLLAALAAFGYARSLFGTAGGMLAAVVYTYTPYHLADAYLRGALPEHAAFIFPPLILWAAAATLRRDQPWPAALAGVLAWAGLALTHNLTALLMALAFVPLALALLLWTGRWRQGPLLIGTPLLALGLTAAFWLPALVDSRAVGLGLGASTGYVNHLLTSATWLRRSLAYFLETPDTLGQIYPLAWPALVLLAAGLSLLALRAGQRRLPAAWPVAAAHGLLAAGALAMTTALTLPIWQPLTPILGQLQYPWRFLLLEAVGLLGVAAALPRLLPRLPRGWLLAGVTLLLLLTTLPGLRVKPLPLSLADVALPDRMWAEDAANGQVGATWTGEFLPLSVTEQRWALGRPREGATDGSALVPAPAVTLTRVGYTSLAAEIETTQPLALRLHQFAAPGWQASVNAASAAVYPTGELGLVTVDVPAGRSSVALRFGPTTSSRLGWAITWLALLVWLILALRRARRSRGLLAAGAGVLVLVAVLTLNSLGVGERTTTPRAAQASLEDVAVLLASEAHTDARLGMVEVTLYWLALRETSQNYKVFVHLLGADGTVLTQHDGDPVGGYSPTTRWRAGEIIADRHVLVLPAELPAGAYALRAGLYQVEPLRNLVVTPPTADNRVDIGTVEVLVTP